MAHKEFNEFIRISTLKLDFNEHIDYSQNEFDVEFTIETSKEIFIEEYLTCNWVGETKYDLGRPIKAKIFNGAIRYTKHKKRTGKPYWLLWFWNLRYEKDDADRCVGSKKTLNLIGEAASEMIKNHLNSKNKSQVSVDVKQYSDQFKYAIERSYAGIYNSNDKSIEIDIEYLKSNERSINLEKYSISDEYYRAGKRSLICKIRRKLIPYTDEEIVRQKFVSFLIEDLGVPESLIGVEIPLTKYTHDSRDRADIIIFEDNQLTKPLVVVECKSMSIPLSDDVFGQVERYNKYLHADYMMITNGVGLILFQNDKEGQKFVRDKDISFNQLKESLIKNYSTDKSFQWKYINNIGEMNSAELTAFARNFGSVVHSDKVSMQDLEKVRFIIRLLNLFMNENSVLEPQIINGLNIIKDVGVRYTKYGNASGGNLYGYYRNILIRSNDNNHQTIGLAIYKQTSMSDPYLMVSVDDFNISHHAIELNILKYINVESDKIRILHDGVLTVGKRGRLPNSEVLDKVKGILPELIADQKIFLGEFDFAEELTWQSKSVKEFLSKLLKYSFIRDDIRKAYE